jgi:hypothetical protein
MAMVNFELQVSGYHACECYIFVTCVYEQECDYYSLNHFYLWRNDELMNQ